MSFIKESRNKQGVKVSDHVCETCGDAFTITPSVLPKLKAGADPKRYAGCLAPFCPSYDSARDFDLAFPHEQLPDETKMAIDLGIIDPGDGTNSPGDLRKTRVGVLRRCASYFLRALSLLWWAAVARP